MSKIIEIIRIPVIVPLMERLRLILLSALFLLALGGSNARADFFSSPTTGRVIKVLPLYEDLKGHVATSPSLFDRDAYQYYLLQHTNEHTNLISGIRFDVLWKARNARGLELKLRIELKGIGAKGLPTQSVLEQTVSQRPFYHWISLTLAGPAYKKLGALAAWRATLWDGNRLLGQQQSFLWSL